MDITKYLLLLLIFIIIAQSAYMYFEERANDDRALSLSNQLAEAIGQIELADGSVKTLASQVEDLKLVTQEAESDRAESRATIRAQTQTILSMSTQIDEWFNSSTPSDSDFVPSDTSKPYRLFDISYKNLYFIAGAFQIESPYSIYIDSLGASLDLSVSLVEQKDGTWASYLETATPGITFKNTSTSVNAYKPSFFESFGFFAGVKGAYGWEVDNGSLWNASFIGGIELQRARLYLDMNTEQRALITGEYTFPLFNK